MISHGIVRASLRKHIILILIDRELQHIKKALIQNQYPKSLINSRIEVQKIRTATSRPPKNVNDFTKRIILPYTGRVTSEIANTLLCLYSLNVNSNLSGFCPMLII